MGDLIRAAGYADDGDDYDPWADVLDLAKETVPMLNEGVDTSLDILDVYNGVEEMIWGDTLEGMHQALGGGLGLLSPVGGLGMLLGDVAAPLFFNQHGAKKKANTQGVDGRFHPTSGNARFDDVIEFFTGGDHDLIGMAGYERDHRYYHPKKKGAKYPEGY